MHDSNGLPLKAGDFVLLPAKVLDVSATENYCNVTLESLLGRRPDSQKERVYSINTGVTLRANPGDDLAAVSEALAAAAPVAEPSDSV
jgi:hypothetical protein